MAFPIDRQDHLNSKQMSDPQMSEHPMFDPQMPEYEEFLTSMWRNISRIGLYSQPVESGSDLFNADNFADTDLGSEDRVRQFVPLMTGPFDEEDLILGLNCIDCVPVNSDILT